MSEFVKKNVLGGYKLVQGGQSDPECTHVILTEAEYRNLLAEKARAEQDARNVKYDAEKAIGKAQRDADYTAQEAAQKAQETVQGMEEALRAEKAESGYQRRLNANLLRISKERANADRKLKPKKEHTGYVVVSSAEKEQRFRDGNRNWKVKTLWETVLQSPYSVDFTEEQARKQIAEDLFSKNEDGSWPICEIGINANFPGGTFGDLSENPKFRDTYRNHNVMLERHLRANFRAGYWEFIFLHTKPLDVVPPDMRAR